MKPTKIKKKHKLNTNKKAENTPKYAKHANQKHQNTRGHY